MYYALLNKQGKQAAKCIECGKYEEKCPQNIKIREMLKEVISTLEA